MRENFKNTDFFSENCKIYFKKMWILQYYFYFCEYIYEYSLISDSLTIKELFSSNIHFWTKIFIDSLS